MASHARFGDRVRRLLIVLGIGTTILLGAPGTAPAQEVHEPVHVAHAASGWQCYGCYSCYHAACRAAKYLKDCGYGSCVSPRRGHYYVYYR